MSAETDKNLRHWDQALAWRQNNLEVLEYGLATSKSRADIASWLRMGPETDNFFGVGGQVAADQVAVHSSSKLGIPIVGWAYTANNIIWNVEKSHADQAVQAYKNKIQEVKACGP